MKSYTYLVDILNAGFAKSITLKRSRWPSDRITVANKFIVDLTSEKFKSTIAEDELVHSVSTGDFDSVVDTVIAALQEMQELANGRYVNNSYADLESSARLIAAEMLS